MALYVNQPVFFRSLRIKRYGTFDGRTVPPGEGWRFVDDLGIELPPGFFGAEDVTFESSPTAGLAIIDVVANYEGTFELRKAQVRWGRNSGAAAGTDDAVTTHHFIKLVSGAPSATWVAADFTAIEAAIAAFWTALKTKYDPSYKYLQVRWYKAGPQISPPQPPVRIIDPNVAGTSAVGSSLPPQVAVSVTEKTSDPKSWGRFYLPAPVVNNLSAGGRMIESALQTPIADNADVMYEAFVTAGTPAVVYSSPKPSRPTAGGGTLPARDGRALAITSIQVDDLFDVIRSRRFNEPLLRLQRDIAGA